MTVATTPPQHSVSVSVKCDAGSQQSPLQINQAGASTTCTATVTDTAPPDANGNPRQITPTGTVSWSSSADNGGKSTWPPNPSCTLQRVDDSKAQCQTTYTPTSIGTPPGPNYVDTQHVSAHFNGDGFIHTVPSDSPPTDGVVYVTDQHPVQIDVSCTPGNVRSQPLVIGAVPANDTSQCTVTVTDIAKTGSLVAPTGQVKWSNSSLGTGGAGTFGATSSCTLPPPSANSAQAQCSVTYQATAMGNPDQTDPLPINTHTITAAYQGDWLHPANDPSSKNLGPGKVFVANIHPVTVAVTCPDLGSSAANPLPRGQTTTCFASVTDTSSAPLAPTGTVILSESPDGPSTLTPGSCSLTAFSSLEARCSFDYRPTPPQDPNSPATGVDTHYITGTYSPTDGLHPAGNNNPGQPVYVRPH
ncbi:MAG: hypothetical protein JOZ87_40670 [Chloroflexi bacterium]|nr:hypothetical protein [Chloroflexota bacterium]